jgi:glycosyltransferase involved in cell wall biosynthesis
MNSRVSELNNKQIIAIGRLSRVKGFDRLIEIAACIKVKHNDWKIKIVGEGELENDLKTLSRNLNVENNVLFTPFTEHIQDEYLNSSIYALTSYSEAFPMVLLEAKANGLPIVSFNCPEGPVDIINDGIDGFLVEDGCKEDFCEKLSVLIENKSLRAEMGRQSKIDSFRYMEDKIRIEWEKLLKELE